MKPHSERVRADLITPKAHMASTAPMAGRRAKGPRPPKNRSGTSYTLTREVKEWLRVMIKNHWYLYEHKELGGLWISFHDHNDAMKYKLVWH